MNIVIVGAGGHAKLLVEIVRARGDCIVAYVDPKPAPWLDAPYVGDEGKFDDRGAAFVVGIGGVTPEKLEFRLAMADRWIARGFTAATLVHPSAVVSASARIEPGVAILAQSVVQPSAVVGRAAIINTAAVVEHDASVGEGSHVAPGAIVLGDVRLGRCCMIGSGAIVLQGTEVGPRTLVKSIAEKA